MFIASMKNGSVCVALACWLAWSELFIYEADHKGAPCNSCHVFPDVGFFTASCWPCWPFGSVTTDHLLIAGPSGTSTRLGRQGPPESWSLIQHLKHVRAETSLFGVYCESCQTCSVSRNACLPLQGQIPEPVGSQEQVRCLESQSGCSQRVECL